ncbi:MBL fold metallo-hydrolase [Clostridium sp. MB40-C1]|uniref:MBL fold metallo-hydrolase n=1 Tax=Clostridium sp. MB40-C1 TaxID=3070996 RepID=UPI0027E14061|nr:MBL fold metallo-hydrolase [Clostridium sp. MB40-C1]WMJ82147.1 MBL fold metallo-hydrolase [Clostridium sp. MB40-C1]
MKVNRIGSRGFIFTFDELLNTEFNCTTNVYLIDGKSHIFICDTFLGPKSMLLIKKFIDKYLVKKDIVIFNSHSDWDHIWGNCFFKEELIVAHEKCRENIEKNANTELNKYKDYCQGKVSICTPNFTFTDRIYFYEEGIEFIYSPGHTNDSASCIDKVDNILFVGDNVESPSPYLNNNNFNEYKKTLTDYISIGAEVIVPGHGEVTDYDLVRRNLEYIKKLGSI